MAEDTKPVSPFVDVAGSKPRSKNRGLLFDFDKSIFEGRGGGNLSEEAIKDISNFLKNVQPPEKADSAEDPSSGKKNPLMQDIPLPSPSEQGRLVSASAEAYVTGKHDAVEALGLAAREAREGPSRPVSDTLDAGMAESPEQDFDIINFDEFVDPESFMAKVGRMDPFARMMMAKAMGLDEDSFPSIEEQVLRQKALRGEIELRDRLNNPTDPFTIAVNGGDTSTVAAIMMRSGIIDSSQFLNVMTQLGVQKSAQARDKYKRDLEFFNQSQAEVARMLGLTDQDSEGNEIVIPLTKSKLIDEISDSGENIGKVLMWLDQIESGAIDARFFGETPAERIDNARAAAGDFLIPALRAFGGKNQMVSTDEDNNRHVFDTEGFWRIDPSKSEEQSFFSTLSKLVQEIYPPSVAGYMPVWTDAAAISWAFGLDTTRSIYTTENGPIIMSGSEDTALSGAEQ